MQQIITKSVIDSALRFPQLLEMLTHDEILAEMVRQIDSKSLRQTDVAMKLSIAPARVAEMRAGKRRIQPSEMPELAKLLGMTSDGRAGNFKAIVQSPTIPILGKVAQGLWLEQTVSDPDEAEFVAYDRLPGDPDQSDLFAVIPEGASMNLEFPPGMILICKRVPFGDGEIEIGDLVIVEREAHDLREMTCKILDRNQYRKAEQRLFS
jgi:SOS-response transcriptional repressor LexA